MKERDRIIELVKQGIISSEEAIVLLENMATEKDEQTIEVEKEKIKRKEAFVDDTDEEEQDRASNEEAEKADEERLEKILEELANEATKTSAQADILRAETADLEIIVKEKQEQIMVLNTIEELDTLSDEKIAERENLENELKELHAKIDMNRVELAELDEKLKEIHAEEKAKTKENWQDMFDIPEDWKETASETFNDFGEKMSEAGSQLGRFVKKTVHSITETVNDNVDWKDINIKVPSMATESFDHVFTYPEATASLVDVKVANGEVTFSTWDSTDLKVEAEIKLYGKMGDKTPFESFLERSEIEVDEEHISFQIPNKRVRADLHFYLPARVYDHMSVKMLNGDVTFEGLEAKDVYVKSTNGDMTFTDLTATMLEIEGVNGDVAVNEGHILVLMAETVNGDFVSRGEHNHSKVTNVNGDIRISPAAENLSRVEASVVNGTIKVALPIEVGLDGQAKTSLGKIRNRLTDYELIREKKEKTNQLFEFRRHNEDQIVQVKLNTTTGSIYLKDSDIVVKKEEL